MKTYKVSRRTAFNWITRGYATVKVYPKDMPEVDYRAIARRSAIYVAGRKGDIDLLHECEQAALIALWSNAESIAKATKPEAMAHEIARHHCLNALAWWKRHTGVPLDEWLPNYEYDEPITGELEDN